jgi:hypothetical protein
MGKQAFDKIRDGLEEALAHVLAPERSEAVEHRYVPENYAPEYRWKGEGPAPRRWVAEDGTVVYRSYADYCDD